MQGEASLAGVAYKSLMARLDALREGIALDPASAGNDEELAATYRRRIFKTYFGCGLATSLIVGCAALLPLLYAHPGTARNYVPRQTPLTDSTFVIDTGDAPSLGTERLEFAIPYGQRRNAPFPLQFTGAGPADSVRLVLRNVPEPIWLSKGERQDEHTWVLRSGDLDDLRLMMRDGAPEAFDVSIELIPAGSGRINRGLASVRLVDVPGAQPAQQTSVLPKDKAAPRVEPAPAQKATAPKDTRPQPQRPVDLTAQQKAAQKLLAIPTGKAPAHPPAIAAPAAAPSVEETTADLQAPVAAQIKRPEGMSTLGAVNHPDQEGRQLWWKMPLPTWAPFDARN